jgi:hypothetical protein
MKKILFVLVALLFAAPAWADVDITVTQDEDCIAVISFDARTEPNLVRAISLDIKADNDANIVAVTLLSADYVIHPGTIAIDAQGVVQDYGSPVAPQSDLPSDTQPGLDSNGVTIEMGSLYAPVGPGSPNAPDPCGPLVSVEVDKDCVLTVTANVSRAGSKGVVMESPDESDDPLFTVNLPGPTAITCGVICYTGPQPLEWAAVKSPECWCAAGAPGANPRQCHGDAVGDSQGRFNYWTSTNDLAVMLAAWNKPFADIDGLDVNGTPLICADFDHLPQGRFNYRVSANDLAILIANWNLNNLPDPTCP